MKKQSENAAKGSSSGNFGRLYLQGFTYLELVFVIIIISTLVSMMLVRLLPAIDEAERASVLKLEGQLRSSLTMAAAGHVARGEFGKVRGMVGMNPMLLMMDPPSNYVGERDDDADVPKGHWVFVRDSQRLVYRPREPVTPGLKELQAEAPAFEVQLAYDDVDGDGRYSLRDGVFYGVRLARVRGVYWLQRQPEQTFF